MSKNVDRLKNLIFSILIDADIGDNLRKQTLYWYQSSSLPIDTFSSEMLTILEDVAKNCEDTKLRLAFFEFLMQEGWEKIPQSIFKLYIETLAQIDSQLIDNVAVANALDFLSDRGLDIAQEWKLLVEVIGETQTIEVFSNCQENIWEAVEASGGEVVVKKAKKRYAIKQRITTLWHLIALCHPGLYSNLGIDYCPVYYSQLIDAINDWPYWNLESTRLLVSCGAIDLREQDVIVRFGVSLSEYMKSIPPEKFAYLKSSLEYQKLGEITFQELCQGKDILDIIYRFPCQNLMQDAMPLS